MKSPASTKEPTTNSKIVRFPANTAAASPSRWILGSMWLHVGALCLLVGGIFYQALRYQEHMAGGIGFAMDDAWIHVTVARNFAHGMGWGIVPGRTLSVSTSPTWTLLLSAFFFFFQNPLKITFLCSVASMCVATILFYWVTVQLTERKTLGFIAAALIAADPISIWGVASGLELPLALASLAILLAVYYGAEPETKIRRWVVPVSLAFAGVTRPELFVLIPVALADTFFVLRSRGRTSDAWRTLCTQAAVTLVALAPYFAFNLTSHGKIFPATYYAKTIVRGVGLNAALADGSWAAIKQSLLYDPLGQVFQIIDMLQKHDVLVLLLLTPGVLLFCRPYATLASARGFLLPLAMFLLPWVMGIGSPSKYMSNHAERYFVLFPPLAIMMASLSLKLMVDAVQLRWLAQVVAALMVLCTWRTAEGAFRHIGIDAESTQRLYVDMPIWLNENLDPKAVLAVNDIGGIGYYAPRPLIDVMGLASPEIWPSVQRGYGKPIDVQKLKSYLHDRQVEYIILSPRYYPELTADKATFEPLREWREKYEHGRTISPQVLYKVHWQ